MAYATVSSKGQITIPADIRQALGLAMGDVVVFTLLEDGTTVMRAKKRSLLDLEGMLKPDQSKRTLSIQDMSIGRR